MIFTAGNPAPVFVPTPVQSQSFVDGKLNAIPECMLLGLLAVLHGSI